MATTTNYSWTTPDDTALVKDGAAAIRTLGSSIDTTTKNLNPSTTLGDIEYRSSTANTNTRLGIGSSGQALTVVAGVPSWAASPTSVLTTTGDTLYASAANTLARLGIGSTGQVLTVSGGVPTWATAASGGANWTLLNSGGTTLSGSTTVTISGISAKDKIMVLVKNASSNTDNFVTVRFNTDTGSNYYSFGISNQWAGTYSANIGEAETGGARTFVPLCRCGSSSQEGYGYLLLSGANASGVKVFNSAGAAVGTNSQHHISGGYYNSSSTISSVSIFADNGATFDNGTVFVYTSA